MGPRILSDEAVAQRPELQCVEERVDRTLIPALERTCVEWRLEGNVVPQLGEVAVQQHLRQRIAQGLPGLARHLVDSIREGGE